MSTNLSFFGNEGKEVRSCTPGQIAKYMELCNQKSLKPQRAVNRKSYDEVSKLIQEALNYRPASEKQINAIQQMISQLEENGVKVNLPKPLSQASRDEASNWYGAIKKKLQDKSRDLPPTEKQIELMLQMYPYEGASFEEDLGISRVVLLDEYKDAFSSELLESGKQLFRKTTPEEFKELLETKVKRADASMFLDKNLNGFYEWRKTRVSDSKIAYIRRLEARLTDMKTSTTIEYALDDEGNMVQVNKASLRDTIGEQQINGYVPLDDFQIHIMSNKQADDYINMLKRDLSRRNESTIDNTDLTLEGIRQEANDFKRKKLRYDKMIDFAFKLEAIAGYQNDDLHDAINWLLVEQDIKHSEKVIESKKTIRDFMLYLWKEGYCEYGSLVELCENTDSMLTDILAGVF